MKNKNKKQAFTLIELLVVIAIIGLVAGGISYSFAMARVKSRNTRRITDAASIKKALETYAANYNGVYYVTGANWNYNSCSPNWQTLETALESHLTKGNLPHDIAEDCSKDRMFYYRSDDGTAFKIRMNNPEHADKPPTPTIIDPARDGGADCSLVDGSKITAWAYYSGGAACW